MLKKCSSLWIVLGILLFTPWYVSADSASKKPEALLPESIFEFQPVVEGTQVVHEFIIHNQGDAPLNIIKVQSG